MRFHRGEYFEVYENEQKQTVTVVLFVPSNTVVCEAFEALRKSSNNNLDAGWMNSPLSRTVAVNNRFVGIAKCGDGDEYNFETGYKLARLRAIRAYAKEKARIARKVVEYFEEAANRLENMADYLDDSVETITEEIEKF